MLVTATRLQVLLASSPGSQIRQQPGSFAHAHIKNMQCVTVFVHLHIMYNHYTSLYTSKVAVSSSLQKELAMVDFMLKEEQLADINLSLLYSINCMISISYLTNPP